MARARAIITMTSRVVVSKWMASLGMIGPEIEEKNLKKKRA